MHELERRDTTMFERTASMHSQHEPSTLSPVLTSTPDVLLATSDAHDELKQTKEALMALRWQMVAAQHARSQEKESMVPRAAVNDMIREHGEQLLKEVEARDKVTAQLVQLKVGHGHELGI